MLKSKYPIGDNRQRLQTPKSFDDDKRTVERKLRLADVKAKIADRQLDAEDDCYEDEPCIKEGYDFDADLEGDYVEMPIKDMDEIQPPKDSPYALATKIIRNRARLAKCSKHKSGLNELRGEERKVYYEAGYEEFGIVLSDLDVINLNGYKVKEAEGYNMVARFYSNNPSGIGYVTEGTWDKDYLGIEQDVDGAYYSNNIIGYFDKLRVAKDENGSYLVADIHLWRPAYRQFFTMMTQCRKEYENTDPEDAYLVDVNLMCINNTTTNSNQRLSVGKTDVHKRRAEIIEQKLYETETQVKLLKESNDLAEKLATQVINLGI